MAGRLQDENQSPERPSHDRKTGIVHPAPPFSRGRRGTEDGANGRSCLCGEALTKISEARDSKSF